MQLINQFMPMVQAMRMAFSVTLRKYFEENSINQILDFADKHFEEAKKTLPNVGAQSPWLKNMIGIAYEIGLWKKLLDLKKSLNEISLLTQETLVIISHKTIPSGDIAKISQMLCSSEYVQKIADYSQKREYPDDWLFESVLPGVNDNFQIGMNIYKCPIELLCKRLCAEDFFPYLCLNDFVTHGMLGINLIRTKTLAHGADCCDFRLCYNGKPNANVTTPENTDEFKYPTGNR